MTLELYRPPIGFRSLSMARTMRRLGLRVVNFSLRSRDTGSINPNALLRRLQRRIRPGAIVVFHDGSDVDPRPDRSVLLAVLPPFLEHLQRQGLQACSVSALLEGKPGLTPAFCDSTSGAS